jgi:hypothetical protein
VSTPSESWQLQGVPSPSPAPFIPESFYDESQTPFQPPFELGQMLLEIFAPHHLQCGLGIHIGNLRDSLNLPLSEQRHPVLMNAIYLWACFISRPEPLCQHEDHYLRHALESLPEALRLPDKTMDVIQASCLISMYFLANGRLLEGSYHASAAAALAVQSGFHGRASRDIQALPSPGTEGFDHKPLKCDVRDGERILTFWQVYNLDRCWSVILRKPFIIPDGPAVWSSIQCPWPQPMSAYESGHVDTDSRLPTIRAFLEGKVTSNGFSIPALRVKASTLFAQADALSKNWDPRSKPVAQFTEEVQTLEHSIALFLSTLIPPSQLDSVLPEDKHILIATHTLAHAAIIQLLRSFAQDDVNSFSKCLHAARSSVAIIKHTSDGDFAFLDPIIGPCWWSVAEILIRQLDTLETTWPLMDTTEVRTELATIAYAMTSLSSRFPIIGPALSKLQKRLA